MLFTNGHVSITHHFHATTSYLQKQHMVTTLFLSHMGYCHNMPCSVGSTPTSIGGLGSRGTTNIQLLWHLHTQTKNGNLYLMTIDSYHIHSGLQSPILKDTWPLLWMPNGWLIATCNFLQSINSTIVPASPKTYSHGRSLATVSWMTFSNTYYPIPIRQLILFSYTYALHCFSNHGIQQHAHCRPLTQKHC